METPQFKQANSENFEGQENFKNWKERIIEKTQKLIENKKFITDKDKEVFKEKSERLLNSPDFIGKRIKKGNWENILAENPETSTETDKIEDNLAEGLIWAIEDDKETE